MFQFDGTIDEALGELRVTPEMPFKRRQVVYGLDRVGEEDLVLYGFAVTHRFSLAEEQKAKAGEKK